MKIIRDKNEIIRRINLNKIYGEIIPIPYHITRDKIEDILSNKPKITFKSIANKPRIGLVNGLYATTAGVGGLTIIEAFRTYSETKFSLELTGQQGDVMQESVKCAKTIAWNIIPNEIKKEILESKDSFGIHVHCPEAATPKDGPSAGIAMVTSIISSITGIPIDKSIAMTGEVTLRGHVLPIGGLKEKLLAAHRAGIPKVIIPEDNKKDLAEIPKNILNDFRV